MIFLFLDLNVEIGRCTGYQLGQEGGHTHVNDLQSSEQPWRTAKRRRKFVIGKNEMSDMVLFLEPNLPGVHCEMHQSMRPELYASVKVQIRQEDLRNAWKRERSGRMVQ
ncbi:hypothetical protein JTB14_022101 [Gonioctena quinquepunctata]|nr:hypothetical protein JTB14_022101 [Gonioctena quinquepunctata]